MPRYLWVILTALVLTACGGGGEAGDDPAPAAGAPPDATAAAAPPDGDSTHAAGEMPAVLADFPRPDDVTFPSPPLEESGRLAVVMNSQTDADEVIDLLHSELPAAGYEVTAFIEDGPQWQFVKDGREGLVTVGDNPMGTIITINLFTN